MNELSSVPFCFHRPRIFQASSVQALAPGGQHGYTAHNVRYMPLIRF